MYNRRGWESANINTAANFTYRLNLTNALTYWYVRADGTITYTSVSSYWHGLILRVRGGDNVNVQAYVVWSCIWVYQTNTMLIRTHIYVTNPNNRSETTIRIWAEGLRPVLVTFDRVTNTTLQIRGAIYDNRQAETAITSFTENHTLTTGFFNNMRLEQTVEKWWSNLNYKVTGEIYWEDLKYTGGLSQGQPPLPTMSWWEKLAWDIWNALSGTATEIELRLKPYAEYLGYLGRQLVQLFVFAGSVIASLFQASLPFLPVIAILWFIDAAATSIYVGSFQPIGNAFLTIWDLIRSVGQTIANILSAIWDFITFWS